MSMKTALITLLSVGVISSAFAADTATPFKSDKEKLSYSIGMDIGQNLKRSQVEVDPETLSKGLKDFLNGGKTLLTEEQKREVMTNFQKDMREKQMARMKEQQKEQQEKSKETGDKNKKEGEAFLAENKKKPGVITTPSGLQYKVITMGTGPKPKTNDTVITHYRGTFIDGKEFDSSYKRGEPFVTPVTRVIKGWTEALMMMPVGSKWQLVIPPDIAYGQGGMGIPPNSVLQFDMELIGIQEPGKETKPAAQK
jgi:FKBP-type peptidyl-prolyl cis-trans isomerase FklB